MTQREDPTIATERRLAPWAATLLGLAGLCGVLSALFGWARVTYPTSEPSLATEAAGHPRIGLYLGLFMILAAAVAIISRSREAARAWCAAGIACGVAVGAFAVFDLIRERHRTITALVDRSAPGAGAHAVALRAQLRALVRFSFRPGVYLAVLAAALSVAAAVAFISDRRVQTPPSEGSGSPQPP